jgi:hypothetical protein
MSVHGFIPIGKVSDSMGKGVLFRHTTEKLTLFITGT